MEVRGEKLNESWRLLLYSDGSLGVLGGGLEDRKGFFL